MVHGGLGGVGHVAIQLARHAGGHVSTTVEANSDFEAALELGAEHAINFREEEVAEYVRRITSGRGFDVVIDTVGAQNLLKSFEAAAVGGAHFDDQFSRFG
ncbi:hypothetical protein AJ87_09660 [Rhizobium yanglingense]|nr:hypothetical protein AJ87_09660 [Rhizobium yanglingense]